MKRYFPTLFFALLLSVTGFGQGNVQASFASGLRLAREGKFESALVEFNAAVRFADAANATSEMRSQLTYNIAVCHFRLGRLDTAVAEFESAISLRPGYEKALYGLGMAEAERQNWPAAEKAFLSALAVNRQNAEAWFDLGYVYIAKNDFPAAKIAFELSAKYNSVDAAVSHNNIGVILAAYGDTRLAIAQFERALRLSGGKLETASQNLTICRNRLQYPEKMLAIDLKFEFAKRTI